MIDFANYTPAPSAGALAVQIPASEIGKDWFSVLMMHTLPGIIDSGLFVLILLGVFIVAIPVVFWLIQAGRIKNDVSG